MRLILWDFSGYLFICPVKLKKIERHSPFRYYALTVMDMAFAFTSLSHTSVFAGHVTLRGTPPAAWFADRLFGPAVLFGCCVSTEDAAIPESLVDAGGACARSPWRLPASPRPASPGPKQPLPYLWSWAQLVGHCHWSGDLLWLNRARGSRGDVGQTVRWKLLEHD